MRVLTRKSLEMVSLKNNSTLQVMHMSAYEASESEENAFQGHLRIRRNDVFRKQERHL